MRSLVSCKASAWRGEPRLAPFVLLMVLGLLASGCEVPRATTDAADTVLLTLPQRPLAERTLEQQLRKLLQDNPRNGDAAARLAQHYITRARLSSDPRFLGYAERALAPWWFTPAPPPAVWRMRAILHQAQHRFDRALDDLDRLLTRHRDDHQARLTRAMVRLATGHYRAALADCARVAPYIDPAPGTACMAGAMLRLGEVRQSTRMLAEAAANIEQAHGHVRQWIYSLQAEVALARGDSVAAEQAFQRALAEPSLDAYTLRAYSDYLLSAKRYREVLVALRDTRNDDALTLNAALAARGLGLEATLQRLVARLQTRFRETELRGDGSHYYAQSLYALAFDDDIARALDLAKRNWRNHKEPRDAALLARTASLAGDRQTMHDLAGWIAKHGALFAQARSYLEGTST